jgi:DNA-binding protein H-NS
MTKLKTTEEEREAIRHGAKTLRDEGMLELLEDFDQLIAENASLQTEAERLRAQNKTLQKLSDTFAKGLITAAEMLGPVAGEAPPKREEPSRPWPDWERLERELHEKLGCPPGCDWEHK